MEQVRIVDTLVADPSTACKTWVSWLERKSRLDGDEEELVLFSLSSTLLEVAVGEGDRKMLATLAERFDMVDLWSLVCTGIDEGRNLKIQLDLKGKKE